MAKRFQLNIFSTSDHASIPPQDSKRVVKAKNRLIGQFDLPINQLSISTVVLSGLVTGGSYSTLVAADRVVAMLPAYTEWPLFFTTLRLVVASVA